MTNSGLLAFSIGMFLLSISPGPGVATVVSRSLGSGARAGFAVISGLIVGDVIYLGIALVGLTAIAATAAPFFAVVKYAGAAYLMWLGYQSLRHAGNAMSIKSSKASNLWKEAVMGLLVTLGNPKPILFYGALVPTFLDVNHVSMSDFVLLVAVVAIVSLLVLGGYALLAARARKMALSSRKIKRLNQITGLTLIGAGAVVATR